LYELYCRVLKNYFFFLIAHFFFFVFVFQRGTALTDYGEDLSFTDRLFNALPNTYVRYRSKFEKLGIDSDLAKHITDDNLKNMGILDAKERIEILKQIQMCIRNVTIFFFSLQKLRRMITVVVVILAPRKLCRLTRP
jgi:hypothetical protein